MYDHSSLATFQQCPEKYRLKFHERLVPTESPTSELPLTFGKALHAGLAAYYREGRALAPAEGAFLATYTTDPVEESLYLRKHGLAVLAQYAQQYGGEEETVVAVEQPLILKLTLDTDYLVKADTIIRDAQGGHWVLEHKTTASKYAFTDRWWAQFEPNSQLTGQWVACQRVYGDCQGVIVNGISLSHGIRKGFVVECQRQSFQRTAEQVADWEQNVLRVIRRLQMEELTAGPWEKDERQCTYCSYRPLCLAVGAQGVREAMYTTVEQPLQYQQED